MSETIYPAKEESISPKKPLITLVAAHDSLGGAARAIYRVFKALQSHFGEEAEFSLRVIHKTREEKAISGGKPERSKLEFVEYFVRTRFRKYFPRRQFISDNTLLRSQALFPSGLGRELNRAKPDLIMLGWLGNGTLSIREIGRLKGPTVFRLSDMWVFSGAEHYTNTGRYAKGYSKRSRPVSETGPDIDRETFLRKQRHWRKHRHLISLSSWLTGEARKSTLTNNWPVTTIPVPMDVDFWNPQDQHQSRKSLGLPVEERIVLFGAGAGTSQPHKGADLLFEALGHISSSSPNEATHPRLRFVIFGQKDGPDHIGSIPITYLGRLDDEALRNAYSAADVMVVPSRLEAFGQVAAEAQSCGTPVVVFDNSGLADVVADGVTGRVVPAFDTTKLAEAISWVLSDPQRLATLKKAARERAVELWHPQVVAAQYMDVFRSVLGKS